MIPAELLAALTAADESYLIGLSNKGTVNRAKKDLAKETPVPEPSGNGVRVSIGGESCTITAPLGRSTCSCPSTTMCRHRIGAILFLKSRAGEGKTEESKPAFSTLRAYPVEKLSKQLGAKRLSAILFRHKSGEGPRMEEDSVITVELPWHSARVRLLDPVEDSTCSCRSGTFCNHRAEALLCWQLKEGIATPEALAPVLAADGPDPETIRGVCAAVRETLEGQMVTGIARMPPSVSDTVERMAALSHTAGLANLERALRRLHGEYAACFARSATFRSTALLSYFSHAYRLAAATEAASPAELPELLGTFREEYDRVGRRKLYLLGWRDYHGRSGYSGTIYYFYDREHGGFYTYSDLRPTFYDHQRRRSTVSVWDLPCTLKQAWNCLMDLTGAKCNASGNLSATQECKATLIGQRPPWEVIARVETDFEGLLPQSAPQLPEGKRLALVRPAQWRLLEFDRVRQVFSLKLLDSRGRDLFLEVRYQKEEAELVEHLEKTVTDRPCGGVFFVSLYREGDKLKGYPIEYFADWREDHGNRS